MENKNSNKKATLELGTRPVGSLLFQYAMPAIVAMTASSLYNIIDRAFIGHEVGPIGISGLAITFPFMNLSGEAVLPLMSYYNISPDELVVVYDDLDLEPGKLRLRQSGSAGGHNGVKSIIEMLGTQDFKRVKIGIGRPQYGRKVVDHVLQRFDTDDRALIEQKIDQTTDLLTAWAKGETFVQLMNQYN